MKPAVKRFVTNTSRPDIWRCASLMSSLLLAGYIVAQDADSTARIRSEVQLIGTAEVRAVAPGSLFDPHHQPQVYWHDPEWNLDLITPSSDTDAYRVSVRSNSGSAIVVELPRAYEQVNSIFRAPTDKAIITEEDHTASGAFAIIDLKTGRLIDNVGMAFSSISPNRRFIVYQNWYPAEATAYENVYRVYDTLKSPRENVCGYRNNDPEHEHLDDGMRGFQIYPPRAVPSSCSGPEDDGDNNIGTNFTWAPDSSKIVFADIKNGVLSFVLVSMPAASKDNPKISVYPFKGTQDVCAGAADSAGEPYCDYHVIQSIGWDGDAVKAAFRHQFGTKLDLEVTLPVSIFVPIG